MNLRMVKYIGRGLALGFAAILAFNYYVFTQVCANTVIMEELSPGSAWKIVLFERGCGSFTGNSTQVSLIRSEAVLESDAGNIYVAEGDAAGYAVEWLSATAVKVSGVKGENHLKVAEHEGISVRYEAAVGSRRGQ